MLELLNGGIQRPAYSPHLGDGWHDAFAGVDVETTDVFKDLGIEPGDFFAYEGRIYQAVRARSALAAGDLVRRFYGGATRSGTVSGSTTPTAAAIRSSFNLTESDLATIHKRHPVLAFISSGTGIGQLRRVKDNTDSTDSVSPNLITIGQKWEALSFKPDAADTDSPDAFDTVPAASDGLDVIVPWEVEQHAAATDFVHAVSLGTVTSGNYTIVGVAGPFLVKAVGSTHALTARGAVVPSATAGTAKGPTGTMTVDEAARIFGWSYSAYSGASALRLVELFGNFAR